MYFIYIPEGVREIGEGAFWEYVGLTSVTFGGSIREADFSSNNSFTGDLRATYLAGGGPGTYTRPNGGSTTWTKQ
ncbi:MAG: leucine-rich repeat domain-containing protein [Spirochaetaceae bacterium]|jgi:hypothetical protein|nr:leucine-rich repeat domain-containing protein [Spirochaetaceae bacterium]